MINANKVILKKSITFYLLFLFFSFRLYAQSVSGTWVADAGNGNYKNPVLYADYSDPDAIRVGKDYFMVASSFTCMPGLPILHSKDLVNWKVVNYALRKQIPENIYDIPQHGKGVWAPCIRYYKEEYYIYYPDPDFGIYMIKARNPLGQWSVPKLILQGKGIIDPAPFWDDDGRAYLGVAWAGSRAGINSLITIYRMDVNGEKVIDDGKHVYDGHGKNHTTEGPKIYKRKGWYYIFAPAGGVVTGWQLVLRAKNIYGPYQEKIVLAQGKTAINGPHQGAYIETPGGQPWFLHFQDLDAYGRVIHLEPVKWIDSWPVIGEDPDGDGVGQPVAIYIKPVTTNRYTVINPSESDEFNRDTLGLQWQWMANPKIQWSSLMRAGNTLRLFAYPADSNTKNLWTIPNLLMQKFPAPDFVATTKLDYTVEWDVWQGKKAGLVVFGLDYAYLAITKDSIGYKLTQVACANASTGNAEIVIEEKRIKTATVYLRAAVTAPGALVKFSFSENGTDFTSIGSTFPAKPGKWTGAKIGVFCLGSNNYRVGGYADFDWFRVTDK